MIQTDQNVKVLINIVFQGTMNILKILEKVRDTISRSQEKNSKIDVVKQGKHEYDNFLKSFSNYENYTLRDVDEKKFEQIMTKFGLSYSIKKDPEAIDKYFISIAGNPQKINDVLIKYKEYEEKQTIKEQLKNKFSKVYEKSKERFSKTKDIKLDNDNKVIDKEKQKIEDYSNKL